MLHTTRAIVLRTIKHADSRTVLKAYTEVFGTRSYMVRTSRKESGPRAALQPLTRLELVVTESSERDMHSVRELRVERPFMLLHRDPLRGALALYAQEVFHRTLRTEAPDEALFDFVQEALEEMDTGTRPGDFPVWLLTRLSEHLGFFPEAPAPGQDRFDLREGRFFTGTAPHELCMEPPQARLFAVLLANERALTGDGTRALDPPVRRKLLDDLLLYYRLHVEGFGELRSPEVLRQVLG